MSRANQILLWAEEMFGRVALDREERASRFLEEALELAQISGLSAPAVLKIVARVYERRPGEQCKEIAQAGMTLEALAANVGVDLDAAIQGEFDRVRAIPKEEWQRRHDAKVKVGIAGAYR